MTPHVACIMPTRGRNGWVMRALKNFVSQSYPNKSLIIEDDEDARSFPEQNSRAVHIGFNEKFDPIQIYYTAHAGREPIGQKRNIACERAYWAHYIAHFDDDDWSAPDRLSTQIAMLECSGKAVAGYSTMHFTDGRQWWMFSQSSSAIGSSLCYRRDWWKEHPFESRQVGEDGEFARLAQTMNQLVRGPADHLMVASIHPGNTSPRNLCDGGSYTPVERPANIGSPFE